MPTQHRHPPGQPPGDLLHTPHRRYDPLGDQWVLVSPHRMQRPWQGKVEPPSTEPRLRHDPGCYLCPGNARAGGHRNPDYTDSFVFTNDFAALLPELPEDKPATKPATKSTAKKPDPDLSERARQHPLLHAEAVRGTCRVLCFSPRHDLTLAEMEPDELCDVIDLWAAQTEALGQTYRWVQMFENKGALMGASSPHPHGQVWATDRLPQAAQTEDESQRAHLDQYGRPLLLDYADLEAERRERVVVENHAWLAVVPYWAVWPFEALILPRRRIARLPDVAASERDALAELLGRLMVKYDNLFTTSFPYSMGWHGAPYDAGTAHWQLHAHVYPPLLRSASVRKFMVGYELLAEAQRDLTPEAAAERLRALSDIHYTRSR
jgi:UDPglucose--hexose-1-phosphate uridylyltransferase